MSKILYSSVNVLIDEHNREILVNPVGERFYHIGHEEMHSVFFGATLSLDENGIYTIEGRQTIYSEHSALGSDYEKLLCKHPKELIKKSSLFWLFGTYRVSGVHKSAYNGLSGHLCRFKSDSRRRDIFCSNILAQVSE